MNKRAIRTLAHALPSRIVGCFGARCRHRGGGGLGDLPAPEQALDVE